MGNHYCSLTPETWLLWYRHSWEVTQRLFYWEFTIRYMCIQMARWMPKVIVQYLSIETLYDFCVFKSNVHFWFWCIVAADKALGCLPILVTTCSILEFDFIIIIPALSYPCWNGLVSKIMFSHMSLNHCYSRSKGHKHYIQKNQQHKENIL